MKITGVSHWHGADPRAALALTIETVPRRAGRFAELALLGAVRCKSPGTLPKETALVLATVSGNRRLAEKLVHDVAIEHIAPMPFDFIASQAGAACQIVANHLGIHGPAVCFSSSALPFENAFAYTLALLTQGEAPAVLIGYVEENETATTGGMSHWVCVDNRAALGARVVQEDDLDLAAVRALWATHGTAIADADADAATALGANPSDDLLMAQRLTDWWERGSGDYLRVRTLATGHYYVLRLTR
jgi:hypothetical protein